MNWITIEDRSSWLIDIPKYHPDSTQYFNFWKSAKKKCIEGYWAKDFGKWRYMPGPLFFYVNFCRILDVNEETKTRRSIIPLLRDLEWEFAYMFLEAKGFSGFKDDNEFTSCELVRDYEKTQNPNILKSLRTRKTDKKDGYQLIYRHCFKDNDTSKELKKYEPSRESIRKLHEYSKGTPLYANNAKNIFILGCLGGEQKVRMYDGSLKEAKEILEGDLLMGVDSKPRKVSELLRGTAPMFNISSRYGEDYKVTASHILHLNRKVQEFTNTGSKIVNKKEDIRVCDFLNLPKHRQKQYYEGVMSNEIEYEKKELVWDPYLLGLWLGDGFKARKMICGSYTNDAETLNWLKNHVELHPNYTSYKITEYTGQLGKQPLWRFSWIDKTMLYKNNWFAKTLFKNKHIPDEYLLSSLKDRYKLLAGMIDSDGNVDQGGKRATITNVDLKLLKQFQEIARSCGFRAVINKPSISGIKNSLKYNLRITGSLSKIPTLLPRKKLIDSKRGIGSNKNDITITPIGIQDYYGFEIDKDHLYLLEDYTVTHNARGSGKSYFLGLAEALHSICFDGAKYYTDNSILNPDEVHVNVGSAESNKSSEICEKIELCMNAFATDSELGVWGDESSDDYSPIPFYKSMSGTLAPNNAKSPWSHRYQQKINGKWLTKGSKSKIVHSVYKDKPTAAAGGRYVLMIDEEVGLHDEVTITHNSNIACTERGSIKFGVLAYIGTSGDIEKIKDSRKMFMDPESYDIISYNDDYENTGKIGFFIPAFYANNSFKDENGNTNVEEALGYYLERRKKAKLSKDSANYEGELMNYPIKPSEMFLTKKGNILPIGELEEQRANVIMDRNRHLYYTVGSLIFDHKQERGVRFIPDLNKELKPIFDYPTPKNQDTEGACICYEPPIEDFVEGKIIVPPIYVIGHDPVNSDTQGEGLSLSSFHVLKMPTDMKKYGGNELVFSYIGRPYMGRDQVNEMMEKAAMWYGGYSRMINFERGGNVKEYFEKRKKLNLLMTQPATVMSYKSQAGSSRTILYGTPVTSFDQKFEAIKYLRDWLLEERGQAEDGRIIRNLNMIRDTRLLEEMIAFDFEGNFDSVLAFAECIVALKEKHNQYQSDIITTHKQDDILSFLNNSIANKYKRQYN